MSLVRIFFNPLDAKSVEEYAIESGTQVIDFLQEHYPCGFDGVLRCFIGVEELAIEDLDYEVGDQDQVTMLVMPGIDPATVGVILLKAAVAFAIGYVINLVFAPDIPGQPNAGEESVVYSLSPSRNRARLGEPVEVVYGRVAYPPSFAAVPYAFNTEDSNDQYVDEILCLGQGYFEIESIVIGEADATTFESGAVRWWQYGPDDHNSTMGVIEADIWSQVQDTDAPFKFYENLYTSPEVSGYEFQDRNTEASTTWELFNGIAQAETIDTNGQSVPGRISNIDTTLLPTPVPGPYGQLGIAVGDDVTLRNTTGAVNDITFKVSSIVVDPINSDLITIYQRLDDPSQISDENPLNVLTEYQVNTSVNLSQAGPYRCQKQGSTITEVICQFLFPQGLLHRDGTEGDEKDSGVSVELSTQEIDANTGAPIGAPTTVTHEFRAKTKRAYRGQVSSGPLTPGAYEVTVTRLGSYDDWRTTENLSLTAVQGVVELNTTPGETYGPVTLLAVRMKATNGLAEAARGRIRVTATRILKGDIVGGFTIGTNGGALRGAITADDPDIPPAFGVLSGPITRLTANTGDNLVSVGINPRGKYGALDTLDLTLPDFNTTAVTLTYNIVSEEYEVTDPALTTWMDANQALVTTYSIWDASLVSSNPITAIKDVWANTVYGLGRPLTELDLATLDPLEDEWAVEGYGPVLNGAFDQRDTGYHAMQVIASMTGSKIVQDGGFTTIVQEKAQPVRKALFSSANVVRDSLEVIYNFDTHGEFDGVEVEWRDPDTFVSKYSHYPADPIPQTPDTYTLFGVTSQKYAEEMARYYWNIKDNRRKLVNYQTELDGWLIKFGDRFGISMPMPSWGESGVVVEVLSASSVRVDQELNWQGSDVVMLRNDQAEPDGPYAVTQGASADIIDFAVVPTTPLVDMEGREPSSYVFGQSESMIMDFIVSKVDPKGETLFGIQGQTYSDDIYIGAPPAHGWCRTLQDIPV